MSKYTTEIRFLCESLTGHDSSVGFNDTNQVITEAAPIIFDFDYPIFDEQYRIPLETKILRHYYTREISEETYGLWKLRLQDRLNVIMPYYNQLYSSTLFEFNPLYDVDLTTQHQGNKSGIVNADGLSKIKRNLEGNDENNENADDVRSRSGDNVGKKNKNNEINNEENGVKNSVKVGDGENVESNRGSVGNAHTGTVEDEGNASHVTVNNESGNQKNTENTVANRNVEYTGENVGTNNSDTKTADNGTATNDGWTLFSDTPQGGIAGMGIPNGTAPSSDLANNMYLTTATHNYGENTTENSGEQHNDSVSTGSESSTSNDVNNVNVSGNLDSVRDSVETGDSSDARKKTFNENNTQTLNTDKSGRNNYVETNDDSESKRSHSGESGNENFENNYSEVESASSGKFRSGKVNQDETINNEKSDSTVSNNTDEYLHKVIGKSGGVSYSAMLNEYRNTFINIDEMIIEELHDLFFGLW